MASRDTQQARHGSPQPAHHRDRAAEIANTFEWLITAFILAFLFRAFVMEAFRIPTGSMADTLMGAHFRLGCPECGYEYANGFDPRSPLYRMPEDTVPSSSVQLPPVRCPSCGYTESPLSNPVLALVYNGDRILVLKCLYQFSPPKRWDVVVFKNPTNPTQNYIKRLVGLPGETIEIVDGDLYVNGQIARKPPMVQEELWLPIYDNDFQPVRPEKPAFNSFKPWRLPFDVTGSAWTVDKDHDPTRLCLDGPADQPSVLTYRDRAPSANDFRATCAYNGLNAGSAPACSDLMVRFHVDFNAPSSQVGVELTRYGTRYRGSVDTQGRMELAQVVGDQRSVLTTLDLTEGPLGRSLLVKFAHLDHQLVLQVGPQKLVYSLDGSRPAPGSQGPAKPQVQVFGAGRLTVSHLAIFRDIYYTSQPPYNSPSRAIEGRPFSLRPDEFFVLGDNSPNSQDARWWDEPTTASRGQRPPRAGVVPREYLMGKALFVYWPGGFQFPWPKPVLSFGESPDQPTPLRVLQELIKLRWIPNVGKMRFIYGGSNPNTGPGTADPGR